jgi:DNA-directed RNA polymerase specialized sigma24 family protein
MEFEAFLAANGGGLRAALVAAYGPDAGTEAAAEAVAYGWEHWDRLAQMDNPAGYLFRVGQTAARRGRRRQGFLPAPPAPELPRVEPALVPALERLSEMQRICVLMVHGFGHPLVEVARWLDIDVSTVRTHCARALDRLRTELDATTDPPQSASTQPRSITSAN